VGRTDIEDALLRLENAILEETRMASAEAVKGIDVLQSIVEARMRDVEGMLEGVGDIMLQGFDEIKKDISQKGINGEYSLFNWLSSPFTMFYLSDAENAAIRTANDVDTAPGIGLATVPGADESIKMVEDDKVHGIQNTVEVVRNGTRDVDDEQGIKEDLGERFSDGAHVILNKYLNHPERL
jgi:hypothetical protein